MKIFCINKIDSILSSIIIKEFAKSKEDIHIKDDIEEVLDYLDNISIKRYTSIYIIGYKIDMNNENLMNRLSKYSNNLNVLVNKKDIIYINNIDKYKHILLKFNIMESKVKSIAYYIHSIYRNGNDEVPYILKVLADGNCNNFGDDIHSHLYLNLMHNIDKITHKTHKVYSLLLNDDIISLVLSMIQFNDKIDIQLLDNSIIYLLSNGVGKFNSFTLEQDDENTRLVNAVYEEYCKKIKGVF